MGARYTVNGQEMSEEEFQKFQQEHGFGNSGFWNFKQRQQKRWDHKPHLYQCYKDTPQGLWNEISFDDFKYDTGKFPKFDKELYYVQSTNEGYMIRSQPVVAIFYDHINDIFLYMKDGGLIKEANCFDSDDSAIAAIKELEHKKCGEHKLFSADGSLLMTYMP